MNLNLSSWSISNPLPTVLLFVVLTLAGMASFMVMKVQDFPDIDFPNITISAALPGASPPQLETEVARKIEDSLANIQGIKHIKSVLSDGMATINAEFYLEKSSAEAMDNVRDALGAIRANLPADLNDPVIKKMELASSPIKIYTVSSTQLDDEALSWLVDNQISKQLMSLRGVGAVSRVGGVDREIRIELYPEQLLALNITATDISKQLTQLQLEAAGGRVNSGGVEQAIRVIATLQTAQDVAGMDITLRDGHRIKLGHIAKVTDTIAEQRTLTLLDGHSTVAFEILRALGASEIEVAERVKDAIATLKVAHPSVQFTEAVDYVAPVQNNYDGSMMLLFEGAALAIIVVFCFLRDWRATLIAAVALPLSIIPTFAIMYFLGFTLNTVSLLALSLVVGVLVDDAIVEIENIERHMLAGKAPYLAAKDAANEIGLAVIATSFTIIAIFLPTSLMGGTIGKYFFQFGWTASIAVFFSLLVARMLTPMMAAYLLKMPKAPASQPAWLAIYTRWVQLSLTYRKTTFAIATMFVAAGFMVASTLPGEFMPQDDTDFTQVSLTLAPGSPLTDTLASAEQARSLLADIAYIESVYTAVGGGAASDPHETTAPQGVNVAVLTLKLAPRSARNGVTRQQIEQQLRVALTALAGAQVRIGGGDGESYELVLAAEDGVLLAQHAAVVERELRTIPGVGAVTSSASLVRPEWVIRPDFARAADLGVSSTAIADTFRIATTGDYYQDLAKINLSERQIPLVVRLADTDRNDIDFLRRMPVPGKDGPVPLQSVAELSSVTGPAELTRYNRMRNVSFNVELNGQPLGTVEQLAMALPSLQKPPAGVQISPTGEAEVMAELAVGFAVAMLGGVLCVYLVLLLLLNALAQPFTVLVALLLAIPGAFFALWVTGSTISMSSMIGVIMLMGITTKNAILLLDYIIIARRDHGLDRHRAIVDACQKRARPIIMTTIAMGAGMLPIALGTGADPSFRAPMAIVVIGGLITSTFLCLLVIPVVYSCVDDAVSRIAVWFRGNTGNKPVTGIEHKSL